MTKLTELEVRHIAKLARISLNDAEVEKYQETLGQLMEEIAKVDDIKTDGDILISPSTNFNQWFEHGGTEPNDKLLNNAPHTEGHYIEVERVLND